MRHMKLAEFLCHAGAAGVQFPLARADHFTVDIWFKQHAIHLDVKRSSQNVGPHQT